MKDDPKRSAQRGLDGRAAHLAVALGGVSVPDREKGAPRVDRKEEGGARDQVFVVQVTRMPTGSRARDATLVGRRCDADGAEEGPEWDGREGPHAHHTGSLVQRE